MKKTITLFILAVMTGLSASADIPAGYYIRPIPQGQIDGMKMSDAEKKAYQNPAYRN